MDKNILFRFNAVALVADGYLVFDTLFSDDFKRHCILKTERSGTQRRALVHCEILNLTRFLQNKMNPQPSTYVRTYRSNTTFILWLYT